MTENNIETLDRETQIVVLDQTILSIEKLITKREIWLNDAKNKRRTTFQAVMTDTNEMKDKLEEYKDRRKEFELKTK
jgi:hypothetical protein